MDLTISLGNALTILTIVIGFVWQHFAMVERIVKLEVNQERVLRDIDRLFDSKRSCHSEKEVMA